MRFNSLQTGKRIQRLMPRPMAWHLTLKSFNSLQTGKRIQRKKGLPQRSTHLRVSIPFKRESVSKEFAGRHFTSGGNGVSIPFKRESVSKVLTPREIREHTDFSFNSLQTGKRIQRHILDIDDAVSLMFQFPSNGKAYPKSIHTPMCLSCIGNEFQFPSNGKAYPKDLMSHTIETDTKFQFPSNGKAYPKRPHFKPSGAVPPNPQKHTRTARGNFLLKF